jgi:hypothetical protein
LAASLVTELVLLDNLLSPVASACPGMALTPVEEVVLVWAASLLPASISRISTTTPIPPLLIDIDIISNI